MLHVPKPKFRPATRAASARSEPKVRQAAESSGTPMLVVSSLDNAPGHGQTPANNGFPTIGGGDIMKTNYPAVIACAVVYWLLGALWYAVLFNKQWMALEGPQPSNANPILPYIISFLLDLLIALVLAQVCAWRNANTAARGAAIGIILWLGIVGPIVFTTYMYEGRPHELFAINEFYPLVGMCLMGAILGAWTKKAA